LTRFTLPAPPPFFFPNFFFWGLYNGAWKKSKSHPQFIQPIPGQSLPWALGLFGFPFASLRRLSPSFQEELAPSSPWSEKFSRASLHFILAF